MILSVVSKQVDHAPLSFLVTFPCLLIWKSLIEIDKCTSEMLMTRMTTTCYHTNTLIYVIGRKHINFIGTNWYLTLKIQYFLCQIDQYSGNLKQLLHRSTYTLSCLACFAFQLTVTVESSRKQSTIFAWVSV